MTETEEANILFIEFSQDNKMVETEPRIRDKMFWNVNK